MEIIIGIVFITILIIVTFLIRVFIDPFNLFDGVMIGFKVSTSIFIILSIAVLIGFLEITKIPLFIVIPGLILYPIIMGVLAFNSFYNDEDLTRFEENKKNKSED